MYHILKEDPWRNKVPLMSVSYKKDADEFVRNTSEQVEQVVRIPHTRATLIKM
jgi:hypothetical protein